MSPRFVFRRENVPCVAEVVNRSLKADCTDFTCCIFLNRKHGRHARLGLNINKKPLRHCFLHHSSMGRGELCCPVDILLYMN